MKSRFVSAAEKEFSAAAAFYEEAEPGLGEEFVFAVLSCVDLLTKQSLLGVLSDGAVRTISLRKFPYSIVYEVCRDEIVVFAIAHQKRRPMYWRDRL